MDLAGLNVRLGGLWMDLPEDSPLRDWTAITDDSGDCVDNHEIAGIYRRARTGINVYRREAEDGHAGRRLGGRAPRDRDGRVRAVVRPRPPPRIRRAVPHAARLHQPGRSRGPDPLGASPTRASAPNAAAKARAAVADRTFTEHAKQLLRLLDRQPVTM